TKLGNSAFHLSCSDDNMDGPEDCGKLEGDLKATSGQTNLINDWILAAMTGPNSSFDCDAGGQTNTPQQACDLPAAGAKVSYQYKVTNNSASSVIINVEDDK